MSDIREKILNAFTESNEPLKAEEIADRTGIDKNEVSKQIKKLKAEKNNRIP